jgi:molecular chaperone GrpE
MADKKPKKAVKPRKSNPIEEITADLQRLQADFINYKQRAEKEKVDYLNRGRETAALDFLPIFDNLERAFAHTPEEIKDNPWVKGILGVDKQLQKLLDDLGLEKIKTVGELFDPTTMEAITYDEGSDVVSEELRSGYLLNGKVIRAAMVKVG